MPGEARDGAYLNKFDASLAIWDEAKLEVDPDLVDKTLQGVGPTKSLNGRPPQGRVVGYHPSFFVAYVR